MSERRLLVCDLDNTLYDWVAYFVPAFYAMVDVAVGIAHCDRETLLDDFRKVHQAAHDSEHPFALLETNTIKNLFPHISKRDLLKKFDPAFHAFNSVRKHNLKTYPNVHETLKTLSDSGITIVAHTESKLVGTVDRLRRLDLHHYFAKIYCRERSAMLAGPDREGWFDNFPMEKIVELAHHQTKPNVDVLLEICSKEATPTKDAVYVGDSVAKDIMMAKRAEVFSVWAKYGSVHDPSLYEQLVRISHWTPSEIEREKKLRIEAQSIKPDLIADRNFCEVMGAFPRLNAPSRAYG